MKEKNELFDRKHLRLWRISSQADTLSSVVLVIYALIAIIQTFEYITNKDLYTSNLTINGLQTPLFILRAVLQAAVLLLQGAIYYAVLKGVSLGLNVIVETDINYRDRKSQEGAE